MTQITIVIELLSYDGEPSGLLKIETGRRNQISSRQEVGQFLTNLPIRFCQGGHKVFGYFLLNDLVSTFRLASSVTARNDAHDQRNRPPGLSSHPG
jgi:hypothetical protein